MKASILVLAWLLVCGHAKGQVYFDHLFDGGVFTASTEGIWGGLVRSDTDYVFVSFSRDIFNFQSRLFIVRIGIDGETIQTNLLGDTFQFYRPTGLVGGSSGHYCVSTYAETGTNMTGQKIGLTKISNELEHQWTLTYGSASRNEYAVEMMGCTGGFLLLSQSSDSLNTTADMHVIKVDSGGSFIWEGYYGGPLYEGINSAVLTPDSGFLLLGWTRSYGAGQRDFYLVKTDSLGNQEWQRTYGGGGEELGFGIIRLTDGNYFLTGAGSQGSNTSIGRCYKIRPDGSVLWVKTYLYPGNSGNNFYKTIEMPNRDLVSVGLTDKNHNNNAGWLVRADSNGTVIWQREYNKNELTDLFYSVLATDDGGFLLSGQAMNLENGSQDAWLLKVDSVGCPYPNCTVGIDEAEPTKVVADVWPNPASQFVRVQVSGSRQQQEGAAIVFTDMMGRSYSPPVAEKQGVVGPYLEYDVSGLANGLYVVSIVQNEAKATVRIVVQH